MNAFETFIGVYGDDAKHWIVPHIEACATHGLAILSPELVVLCRPVDTRYPPSIFDKLQDITEGWNLRDLTLPSAGWHVLYACGNLPNILSYTPYRLPWVLWERHRANGTSKVVKLRTDKFYERIEKSRI